MPKIQKLSPHEAQKIAAGEVVERPANIVKELIENALDAGATTITLFIEQAGKKLIRVQDNGCGMDEEDARLCFEHHATSKLRFVDDLQTINTFGFRGEALSSIASVSYVTLITKQADTDAGIKLVLKGGSLTEESAVPATTGTDITITDLFYNMPARKKFLKATETEWRHIQQLFFAIALAYTNVSLKLYSEQKLLFNCPATDTLHNRWTQLIDYETSTQLIPLQTSEQHKEVRIDGVISHQQFGRYDRSGIYFFVNNRWVKDYKLNRILLNGYQDVLPKHKYPIGCVKIDINPALIDVNIHPRKEEVQFLHPGIVQRIIKESVEKTLAAYASIKLPPVTPVIAPAPSMAPSPSGAIIRKDNNTAPFMPFNFDSFFREPFAHEQASQNTQPIPIATTGFPHASSQTHTNREDNSTSSAECFDKQQSFDETTLSTVQPYAIIGTYKKTYILLEQGDELIVIDQHAAHERVLYEQYKHSKVLTTVQLLFPQTYCYTPQDIALLTPYLELICKHGIEIAPFSDTKVVVTATPINLKHANMQELINNCIALVYQEQHNPTAEIEKTFMKALLADMSCKAAVKAGDTLSHEQIAQLIQDFNATTDNFSCPHGRPTTWRLGADVIEKKFKRDYR